jgi:hypothetical protein
MRKPTVAAQNPVTIHTRFFIAFVSVTLDARHFEFDVLGRLRELEALIGAGFQARLLPEE